MIQHFIKHKHRLASAVMFSAQYNLYNEFMYIYLIVYSYGDIQLRAIKLALMLFVWIATSLFINLVASFLGFFTIAETGKTS